nr:hypothetical protein BN993_00486 [Virgibacillus halodenitrificans]
MLSIADGRFPPAWLQPLPPLRSVQGLQLMLFRLESWANRTLVMQSLPQDVAFLDCHLPFQSIGIDFYLSLEFAQLFCDKYIITLIILTHPSGGEICRLQREKRD